jgi:hypothetical protein
MGVYSLQLAIQTRLLSITSRWTGYHKTTVCTSGNGACDSHISTNAEARGNGIASCDEDEKPRMEETPRSSLVTRLPSQGNTWQGLRRIDTTHTPNTRGHSSGYYGEKGGGDGLLSGPLFRRHTQCQLVQLVVERTPQRLSTRWQASKGTRRETINGPLGTIRLTRCGTLIYDCDANTVGEGERPPEGVHQTMRVHPTKGMSDSSDKDRLSTRVHQ